MSWRAHDDGTVPVGSHRAGGTPAQPARPSAADILDTRLATGEIGPDEHRVRLAALGERDQAG